MFGPIVVRPSIKVTWLRDEQARNALSPKCNNKLLDFWNLMVNKKGNKSEINEIENAKIMWHKRIALVVKICNNM